jgi:CYTH domain-containing protein
MGVEIERKFLVGDPSVVANLPGTIMRQGYLSIDPERTVRVRVAGRRAFLTIKGSASESGASRAEYEYEIPVPDAEELLDRLALRPLVEKTRYRLAAGRLVWEIDIFSGENDGLAVAEVELPSEATAVALPDWIGEEVTGDVRYYNASLVSHPYKEWDRA